VADPFEPTDENLIAAALDGDVRALDALLRRHEGNVLRLVRLLGVPLQDREDVAQEVFLRVFRHLRGYRVGHSFSAWIYRVAVNSTHDYRERVQRTRRGEAPWSDNAAEVPDPAGSPEAAASQALDRSRLEAALDSLSERERAVFVLKELEGLETIEAARVLGVTTITVRRHLGLARRRLRAALAAASDRATEK
jgi:RNA polymerase sigma-70 factor (ECF subfamily)